MPEILIATKPVTETKNAALILVNTRGELFSYELREGEVITIAPRTTEKRYCQGWYDIESHQNFPCEETSLVDAKFDSCYACRSKTDFNPGFYNSASISPKQAEYNAKPHSVYVAFFGSNLYKAGILSDSRGLDRIYEQGAIYYAVVERAKDAHSAHVLEEKLIGQGLRNSVTKNQKQSSYELLSAIDDVSSRQAFKDTLHSLGLANDLSIKTTLDIFFFGARPPEPITTVKNMSISGTVKGIIGSYLVVENHDRLFGVWLGKLCGYEVEISQELKKIAAEPMQSSLFF